MVSRDWELEQIGKCCSKATHFHLQDDKFWDLML